MVSLFKHSEVRDNWYYNRLRRYHERLSIATAKPLEMDGERWTTSKNVGKHYEILEQTFVDLGFAFKNPSYSADEPLSESIKFHPWALGQIVSFDESRFRLDMTDGDKNTRTTIAKELSDKGQTHAVQAGGSATVVGGSLANGFATTADIIFAAESIQAIWTEGAPVSDILDVSQDLPRVFLAFFACNTTCTMKHEGPFDTLSRTSFRCCKGEAGSDPRGHLWVTWGVYLGAGKPPLADIILSHPPDIA